MSTDLQIKGYQGMVYRKERKNIVNKKISKTKEFLMNHWKVIISVFAFVIVSGIVISVASHNAEQDKTTAELSKKIEDLQEQLETEEKDKLKTEVGEYQGENEKEISEETNISNTNKNVSQKTEETQSELGIENNTINNSVEINEKIEITDNVENSCEPDISKPDSIDVSTPDAGDISVPDNTEVNVPDNINN